MKREQKKIIFALASLTGLIIGVGIFGVPYVSAQAGFGIALAYFLVLGAVVAILHLLYGEVVLRTEGKHRLVGFAEKYLGQRGKKIVFISTIFSFYGALLAYIIVGGKFLFNILGGIFGGNDFVYQIVFFAAMAIFVFAGLKLISSIELWMTAFLILVFIIIIGLSSKFIDINNFAVHDWSKAFLPYGVILFALGGGAAVPEIRDILRNQEKDLKKVIAWGTIVPIILTALFAFAVVGVTGLNTTEEAISGLGAALGHYIVFLGAIAGLLAVATSFLILGLNLKEQFQYDLKFNKYLAWGLSCFAPFLIFLLASPGFIQVIGFTGAVFAGLDGILMVLIYLRAKRTGERTPEYSLRLPSLIPYLIMLIFALGMIYELWRAIR